jgi:histidinol-phosphatase
MPTPPLNEILEFALALSREAGQFILPRWKKVAVHHKDDGSEVTEADRGGEQLLRRRIAERYPDHAILGEEFGGEAARDAEHLWILDPVDGTASFALGLPLFGTLIGYSRQGEVCVGVIGAHALGETTYAATGHGCWYQADGAEPQRVSTSAATALSDAYVMANNLERTDMDPRAVNSPIRLSRLHAQVRRFRWSGGCMNYALLCQGRIDVALDPRMSPWDIAALAPCVREAGGVVSSLDGNPDAVWQPNLLASANAALHAKVLESLESA